jgi:hypothetical protein
MRGATENRALTYNKGKGARTAARLSAHALGYIYPERAGESVTGDLG